ncbi:replication-associated recombination protein A [Mycoplasmopsis glycophila]|uniref:ATPase n=1 Tax=Mycoplasmopsis glycophila TaxID=171285 RepID=A0A449AVT6_9BACT|nr:replication-associated recombination protein A [Mycoplasmopsis glycophila]VEU70737.1 ATPase [Mycoplasmopsis glycophila]
MNKNLANEIRPKTIDEIIGQQHLKDLFNQIVKNKLGTNFIFYGESGIGKTSSAIALANDLGLKYDYFNASVNSKADLVKLLENNELLIIDEIHRLNKDKQDILLSYLEFDKITVYATTTENPYFKVNPALRSRMQILQFYKLTEEELVDGLSNVATKYFPKLQISKERLLDLARFSAGDFRSSINNLQMLAFLGIDKEVSKEDLRKIIPNINFYSDSSKDSHYDNLSAFHKSLRGSDVDASLYYGFLILKSGDIDGLFRRMLCASYEDVGLASPSVALRTETAIRSYERLGEPEGKLAIANAIIDISLAPKSNSAYLALNRVEEVINSGKIYQMPKHLKDAHYSSAQKLGNGIGYLYPHDNKSTHFVKQQYLPNELKGKKFYQPANNKVEISYQNYWENIKKG